MGSEVHMFGYNLFAECFCITSSTRAPDFFSFSCQILATSVLGTVLAVITEQKPVWSETIAHAKHLGSDIVNHTLITIQGDHRAYYRRRFSVPHFLYDVPRRLSSLKGLTQLTSIVLRCLLINMVRYGTEISSMLWSKFYKVMHLWQAVVLIKKIKWLFVLLVEC